MIYYEDIELMLNVKQNCKKYHKKYHIDLCQKKDGDGLYWSLDIAPIDSKYIVRKFMICSADTEDELRIWADLHGEKILNIIPFKKLNE